MRSMRLIGLAVVLSGPIGGCASPPPRPQGGPPAAGAQGTETERERADLLRELSLYSD